MKPVNCELRPHGGIAWLTTSRMPRLHKLGKASCPGLARQARYGPLLGRRVKIGGSLQLRNP